MSQGVDYIGRYVDFEEADKSTNFMLSQLKQVYEAFMRVKSISIDLKFAKGAKDTAAAIKELQKASDDLYKNQDKLLSIDLKAAQAAKLTADAKLREAKANDVKTKSIIAQEKELDRLIAKEEKAAKAAADKAYVDSIPFTTNLADLEKEQELLKKTSDTLNDLQRAEAGVQNSATAMGQAQLGASSAIEGAKKSTSELKKEKEALAKVEARRKLLDSQDAAALKNQVREEMALKGSIEQRRAALIRLQTAYDNLSATERKSAAGLRLEGIVSRLTDQVKGLESATGRAQRNVGNYGSALNRVWGGLRQFAYLIPGLGLAGLIGMIVDPIVRLGKAAIASGGSIGSFRDILSKTRGIMDSAKGSFASATATVEALRVNLDLTKKGFIDKNDFLKEYNETIGKTTGFVNDLNEAEQALGKNAEAYIRFTFLKAVATEAFKKAGEEAVLAELENEKELEKIRNVADNKGQPDDGLSEFLSRGLENERKVREANRQKRVQVINDIGEKYMKDAAKKAKEFKFDFSGDAGKGDQIKSVQQGFFDKELKDQVEHYKKMSAVMSLDLSTRINARREAAKKEMQIIKGSRAEQLKAEQDKLNDIKKTTFGNELINATNAYTVAVKKINQNSDYELKKLAEDTGADILAIKYSYLARQKDADKQFHEETLSYTEEQEAKRIEIERKSMSRRINLLNEGRNQMLAGVARNEQDELSKLESERKRGELSETKYHERKRQITEKAERDRLRINVSYNGDVLKNELEAAEEELKNLQKHGRDMSAELLKISEIKLKIQENTNEELSKNQEKYDQAELDILNRKKEAYRGLQVEIGNLVDALGNRIYDGESQEIQRQIDLLEKKKQKEIEVANQTITNEQDKAAAITTIEARSNAEREQLERKQRKVEADRARFEKLASAMRVAIDTFQKVAAIKAMAAVLLANPITAALAPLALSQIPIVLTSGALATAAIAAQKIPEYRHGTKNHPGGLAEVGDGGKKEFVILPSGHGFVTPDRPTTLNLPERTQVLPDAEAYLKTAFRMSMNRPVMPYRDAPSGMDNTEMTRQIGKKLDSLKSVIKNKRETHVYGTHGSVTMLHRWAANQLKYVDEVVRL